MNCPNQPARCGCPEHNLGLAAYAKDINAYLDALHKVTVDKSRRLKAVPIPETPNDYRGDRPQPWEPRPPRHMRAA